MADTHKGPFDRVTNGYDPRQVAAFAAEALAWKRDLAACRSDLQAATRALDHYESVIGSIEEVEDEAASITENAERQAAEIIKRAEDEAARILETAQAPTDSLREPEADTSEVPTPDVWMAPEVEPDHPDPIEEIFETLIEDDVLDPEAEREKRIAAAAANLWKRRGVLTPPE